METNELPQEVGTAYAKYEAIQGARYRSQREVFEYAYRLALQSKEARIKFLEGAFDDMLKTNEGHVIELQSCEEQLKAKDEIIAQWVKITGPLLDYGQKHGEKMGIGLGDSICDGILKHIDSLTSEKEKLRGLIQSIIDAKNTPDMGMQSANDQIVYDAIDKADSLLSQSTDNP